MTIIDTNRNKSKTSRGRYFWCGGCDGNLISVGSKCSRCGHLQHSLRSKAGKYVPLIKDYDE